MAGNIWRAFNRNPDFIGSLGEAISKTGDYYNRESQYAALSELLFPKETTPTDTGNAVFGSESSAPLGMKMLLAQGQPLLQSTTKQRSPLDLSPQEHLRLLSILKMNPVNAVDLLTRTAEANQPKRSIVHDQYLGIGEVTTPRTGASTYQQLQAGAPRTDNLNLQELALKAAGGDKQAQDAITLLAGQKAPQARLLRTETVKENGKSKKVDIYGHTDQSGQEVITNRKYQDFSEKPSKGGRVGGGAGGSGGLSDVDTRFFLGRIKDVTENNAKLGKEATDLMAKYQRSPDGKVTYVDEKTGETVPVKDEAATQLWNELQTKLKGIYDTIDQNDQILLHDNQKVGGTWKIPDRKKERAIGQPVGKAESSKLPPVNQGETKDDYIKRLKASGYTISQ